MKVHELIAAIGDDICVQYLDTCGLAFNWTEKKGTRISFASDARITPFGGTEKLGIIVWLPRDRVKALMAPSPASSEGGK